MPDVAEGEVPLDCASLVTVEHGSRLIGLGFDCQWGAYDLVAEVTGEPDEVFEAYADQIGSMPGFNPPVQIEDPSVVDGRKVQAAWISGDGSSLLRVTMLSGGNRPTVLSVHHPSG